MASALRVFNMKQKREAMEQKQEGNLFNFFVFLLSGYSSTSGAAIRVACFAIAVILVVIIVACFPSAVITKVFAAIGGVGGTYVGTQANSAVEDVWRIGKKCSPSPKNSTIIPGTTLSEEELENLFEPTPTKKSNPLL
jgi:hypothetical protein